MVSFENSAFSNCEDGSVKCNPNKEEVKEVREYILSTRSVSGIIRLRLFLAQFQVSEVPRGQVNSQSHTEINCDSREGEVGIQRGQRGDHLEGD